MRLSYDIARKLYRCPGCRALVEVGAAHVYVLYRDADPPWDHEHWHPSCAAAKLLKQMPDQREVPAARPPKPPRRRRR